MAPLIVPFALLQTSWEDNKLPAWATWWDNDVSINGDRPEYWPLTYTGDCYYSVGHHPRSFWARYVWLGWRNRASRLSQILGHTWTAEEYADAQTWGDPLTTNGHDGWCVNRRGSVYQLYIAKKVGILCYRLNFGYKVWSGTGDRRAVCNVVAISFSLLHWRK